MLLARFEPARHLKTEDFESTVSTYFTIEAASSGSFSLPCSLLGPVWAAFEASPPKE